MKRKLLLILFIPFLFFGFHFQSNPSQPVPSTEDIWVDSVFSKMTLDHKLGQLMWVRAHSDKGLAHENRVVQLIQKYHVGGLTFFQGTPEKQAELTNRFQRLSKIPLMISMDAEWGLGMRLKSSTVSFPNALTLGAIQDNRLIYEMGVEIARQLNRMGVHVNFAPVADINNNPNNPVINYRSFGEDRYNVAAKSYQYMQALQDHNVLACAKHFPGHGDTDVDSHYDLPVINHNRERLDSIELFPFQILMEQEVASIMVGHLHIPALDSTPNFPMTLSRKVVTDVVRNNMNYDGLIITDGLGMKGVTKHYGSGEVEAMALAAGNDICLLPQDVGDAFKKIKEYIAAGKIDQAAIDKSVKKVLRHKYKLGLTSTQTVEEADIREDVNTDKALAIKRQLFQNAMTVVRAEEGMIPLSNLNKYSMASLALGTLADNTFQEYLLKYRTIPTWNLGKSISAYTRKQLFEDIKNYQRVIVSLHNMNQSPADNFGLTDDMIETVNLLAKETEVILIVMGNPYALKHFDDIKNVLLAYEKGDMVEEIAVQGLFGAFAMDGKLPVTASPKSKFGMGVNTRLSSRIGFGLPREVGMNADTLNQIADLVKIAIDSQATPGAVVLVAKDGKIIYEEAFGHHTYNKKVKMTTDDVFDVASVTKIAATTLAVMKLVEEEKLDLQKSVGEYLPILQGSNKSPLKLEDLLAHKAGLEPWIPFFESTLVKEKYNPKLYKTKPDSVFSIPVTDRLFLDQNYLNQIWKEIKESPVKPSGNYVYSDLGLLIMAKIVEEITQMSLSDYVDLHFYRPMGLEKTTFNPLTKMGKYTIPPTDDDRYWRHQVVQGTVHDMAAAMMGGVAGNAGLFTTGRELTAIMQMLLNGGYYGGHQILQPETVKYFTTRCGNCTRRGIGFDMKELNSDKSQNISLLASKRTFGHLGFTGISAWADPNHNLIYLFLSNRSFPKWKGNNILGKNNYRPRIQSIIYKAIEE